MESERVREMLWWLLAMICSGLFEQSQVHREFIYGTLLRFRACYEVWPAEPVLLWHLVSGLCQDGMTEPDWAGYLAQSALPLSAGSGPVTYVPSSPTPRAALVN